MTIFLFMVLIFYTDAQLHEIEDDTTEKMYHPNWYDLDSRPLPSWYDSAKIGIIIHWGIYSVPSYISGEWFWYDLQKGDPRLKKFMKANYKGMRYQDFATRFDGALFDPDRWAELFVHSGAKYVVLTAKHHDGFALFPSGRTNWNSVDVGPKKDIVGELSKSVKKYKMKFGIHYSLLEWFNKLYRDDKKAKYETTKYPDKIILPDIKFLVKKYKPSFLSAGGNEVAFDTYWKSKNLLVWLYNKSPVKDEVVVNDRWGRGTDCRHGGFYNCKSEHSPIRLMEHKWENVFSLDRKSWGYRRDMKPADVLTIEELLKMVVSTVSSGGNVLINVGPTANGTIIPVFEILLKQMGEWLTINGEAIYDTAPCFMQNDKINPDVWYTCNKDGLNATDSDASGIYVTVGYVIFLKWPTDSILRIRNIVNYMRNTKVRIEMLKSVGNIKAKYKIFADDLVEIELPGRGIEVHTYAWVLKFSRYLKPKEKLHKVARKPKKPKQPKKPPCPVLSSSLDEHYLANQRLSFEGNSSAQKHSSSKKLLSHDPSSSQEKTFLEQQTWSEKPSLYDEWLLPQGNTFSQEDSWSEKSSSYDQWSSPEENTISNEPTWSEKATSYDEWASLETISSDSDNSETSR